MLEVFIVWIICMPIAYKLARTLNGDFPLFAVIFAPAYIVIVSFLSFLMWLSE